MTTIRKFCFNDLLRFASVNLDHLAYTANMYLYMKWLVKWPNHSHVAIAPGNQIMGYIIGGFKEKDQDKHFWHGLAILCNVDSEYRRQKLGTKLMRLLQKQMLDKMRSSQNGSTRFPFRRYLQKSNDIGDDHYYIFLYVPDYNTPAQRFFGKIGFTVHATKPTSSFTRDGIAIEMITEVAEERLSRVRFTELCSSCVKAKKKTCSYVCLPYIV